MLRYVGWLRSSSHRRNVQHRIEIANLRASTQVLRMQAACYADRAPENRRDRVRPRVHEGRRAGLAPAAREWTYPVE
eukprot:3222281-Alexandrium_andersonii.AAC.1